MRAAIDDDTTTGAQPGRKTSGGRAQAPGERFRTYPTGTRVNARGRLEIGGCDVVELAREFGTPAYVVSEDDLRMRARSFARELRQRHRNCDVLFGSKAFPCTAVYRLLAAEGLSCDVASGGELALALKAGFDPQRIYLHGNAKSKRELREAIEAGVGHIVLDSFDDFDRLEPIAAEQDIGTAAEGRGQEVLIRVTPGVAGETHDAISTGQADSKFGFSLHQAREAIARAQTTPHLTLVGLHAHIGSQLLELEPFRAAVRALATLGDFDVYNLGGGLGVEYTSSDRAPSIAEYIEAVVGAVHVSLGPENRLLLEPGRALVANSTATIYTVQTVKRTVSTWVAVDGGMSDNLRPMLYGSAYEAVIADRPLKDAKETCHLAGKHCESGDVIARDLRLPNPAPGDVIVTPATGAYGHALANNYNGVPRPPVIFCRDGSARAVVRRESYDDLAGRDLE
ncbi:MAG: diaminopimelate decarboxylase [Solirubrobacteraceae bacterium]